MSAELCFEPPEAELLERILRTWLSDLRMEIVRTASHEYREHLKDEEARLRIMISKIQEMRMEMERV